jgi:hypothetical protein
MSKKAENRTVLRQLFPNVLVGENDKAYKSTVSYCLEDGMIALQSIYKPDGRNPTGREVLRYMLRNAMFYLQSTSCKVFVLILDKSSYVYKVKGVEHKRRAKGRTTIPAPDPQEGEELLPLDKPIPHSRESIMANRKARRHFINQIALAITLYFYPPAGKILIIDGGLFDEDHQPVAIHSKASTLGVANTGKCVIAGDPMNPVKFSDLSQRELTRPENLQNRVGECDGCAIFYLKYLQNDQNEYRKNNNILPENDPVYIDIVTGDTDFIPNVLASFHDLAKDNIDVRVVFSIKKTKQELMGPTRDIFLATKLYEEIHTKLGAYMKRPDLCFAVAMMFAGNDYVDGYFNLVPSVILSAFLKEAAFIGDLVVVKEDGSWEIDYDAYLRFLRAVYCEKYKAQIVSFILDTIKRDESKKGKTKRKKVKEQTPAGLELLRFITENKDLPKMEDWWKILPWDIICQIIEIRNPKNWKAYVPSANIIRLRYLRLSLNLKIVERGYTGGPEIIDNICLQYGFTLIDPSRPLSSHNVRVTEEADVDPQIGDFKGFCATLPSITHLECFRKGGKLAAGLVVCEKMDTYQSDMNAVLQRFPKMNIQIVEAAKEAEAAKQEQMEE